MGCHFLLQGIFLTQGLNPGLLHLLHWLAGSFLLNQLGNMTSLGYPKVLNLESAAAAAAAKSLQLCPTLCDPREAAHQAPPSLGFFRQEHWSGLPFPSPI